jgi:ribosomal protein S18 acetylase RimI-like enzyme
MSSEPIEIRLLTLQDVAVLDRVAEGVFDRTVERSLAEQYLGTPNNYLVVALESGLVVGIASASARGHPDKALQLFVSEVGVCDGMRGRGIGKRLMARLLQLARSIGCRDVWVATEESNAAARAMYTSLRGREDEERAVVYTWRLAESTGDGHKSGGA